MSSHDRKPDSNSPTPHFSYDEAFSRNIGWVTEWEQQVLRAKTVAIAGMGGVGGFHVQTLARLGIGGFHLADMDEFELANFNRQAGATMSTIGAPKVDVLAQNALEINPELSIKKFPSGVDASNVDAFLDGVDLYVDGLDFFVPDVRSLVFRRCAELGIPAITAAPLGMTVAYLIFMPGKMTFEQYFGFEGQPREHQYVNFLLGLSPRGLHRPHLVDPTRLDLKGRSGPSTPMACHLCAGVTGVEAVKVLLGRAPIHAAPWYHQFDAYGGRWVRKRLRGGYRNPLQALRRRIGYRMVRDQRPALPLPPSLESLGDVEAILEVARWTPSGDNSQPWRFEPRGDDQITIHLRDEGDSDIYDFQGEPTLLSSGFLLETMAIAASSRQRALTWTYERRGAHEHTLQVALPSASEESQTSELLPYVRMRTVDRRRYRRTPLTTPQLDLLTHAIDDDLEIRWYRTARERWQMARLEGAATRLRINLRECHEVHERVLDFDRTYAPVGIPSRSLGLSDGALRMMRWSMKSFERTRRLNRYLGGTAMAWLNMSLLPGFFCGAHVVVAWKQAPSEENRPLALVRAGRSIQRFWLTATRLGLSMQPSMAPLIFSRYASHDGQFASDPRSKPAAQKIRRRLLRAWPGQSSDQFVFAARIGTPRWPTVPSRSVRRELSELLVPAATQPLLVAGDPEQTELESPRSARLTSQGMR